MLVEDETGHIWHVEAGDVARADCLALGRAGFTWIVLPRSMIRGLPPDQDSRPPALTQPRTRGTMDPSSEAAQPSPPPPGLTGATPDAGSLARLYRLADCLEALNER